MSPERRDVVIVGGGFYGCCLALFARSVAQRVTIVEARERLMTRASYVNQARIHTGFHYPRSFATAKRSLHLHRRFIADFAPAVEDGFSMLYAVATGSKVSARRFRQMFQDLGAPIREAGRAERALFDPARVEAVFACEEAAFDAARLADLLGERLAAAGVEVVTGTRAEAFRPGEGTVETVLRDGRTLAAPVAFNATYGRLDAIRRPDGEPLPVKNELAEIALVTPPPVLARLGVTVMDGPFFSLMPFPARPGLHSLTHVRHTPHRAWLGGPGAEETATPRSRWLHMVRDAARIMPAVADVAFAQSLFEIKTVLLKNEVDDGRPILVHRHASVPGLYSVLGGKLDNVYDLFDALAVLEPKRFGSAHAGLLVEGAGADA